MANQTTMNEDENDDDDELKERDLSTQVEMIFGWLGVAATSDDTADATTTTTTMMTSKNDYENCCELQTKLQSSRCRSIGNLFADLTLENVAHESEEQSESSSSSSSSSTSIVKLALYDEDDYANTSSETSVQSSLSTASVECATKSSRQVDVGVDSTTTTEKSSRQEITLQVVVDESERTTSGDEIFYINPTVSF